MVDPTQMGGISPSAPRGAFSAGHVMAGLPVPKAQRVAIMSPAEWEEFVEEWASSLKTAYVAVRRFGGGGDMGVDVAGFLHDETFAGGWDNFQCKHYAHSLQPSDVWLEIAKVCYYSYHGEYTFPRKYKFVSPRGTGTKLARLLKAPDKLKSEFKSQWDKSCRKKLVLGLDVDLAGGLLAHINALDFSAFGDVSPVTLVEQHANTQFHSVRFGGGLPPRANPGVPPTIPDAQENRYIEQLLSAYSDNKGVAVTSLTELSAFPDLKVDFSRQRERFYSAESLRNFARDNVPDGTFDALKGEVLDGVVDTCSATHPCGLTRMRATVDRATTLTFSASPLFTAIVTRDKQGMCHMLANEDALIWVPST